MFLQLKEEGRTIILVLHDLAQAMEISDRIVVMNRRQIAAVGTPKECLEQGWLEEVFRVQVKKFMDGEEAYYFFKGNNLRFCNHCPKITISACLTTNLTIKF